MGLTEIIQFIAGIITALGVLGAFIVWIARGGKFIGSVKNMEKSVEDKFSALNSMLMAKFGSIDGKFGSIESQLTELKEILREGKRELKQDIKEVKEEHKVAFTKIELKIESLNQRVSEIDVSLGRLDTRIEERTLRVYHGHNGTEPALIDK